MQGRMTRIVGGGRRLLGIAVLAVAAGLLAAPGPALGAVSCAFAGSTATVSMSAAGDAAAIAVGTGANAGKIIVGVTPCGTATVANTA